MYHTGIFAVTFLKYFKVSHKIRLNFKTELTVLWPTDNFPAFCIRN